MSDWWNPFSWGEREAEIKTQTYVDPLKQNVATPLSAFLASQVGKGLPQYGGKLAPDIDPALTNRYNEFMGLNANDLYTKLVEEPTVKSWKEDILPVVEEGFAGGLRGSGRFRASEESAKLLETGLAQGRYTANKEIPTLQMEMGKNYYGLQDIKVQREYQDWWKSLPENNPVLGQAMQFLSEGTSTGTTLLSYLDPGQEGWFGDLLNAGIGAAGQYFGSQAMGNAMKPAASTAGSGNAYSEAMMPGGNTAASSEFDWQNAAIAAAKLAMMFI